MRRGGWKTARSESAFAHSQITFGNPVSDEILAGQVAFTTLLARMEALEAALAQLEHAVNKNVSGMKVDLGEWLRLIEQAREALGDKVIE